MILAFDMGLGKTLISLVAARAFQRGASQQARAEEGGERVDFKVFVLCPVSVGSSWEKEGATPLPSGGPPPLLRARLRGEPPTASSHGRTRTNRSRSLRWPPRNVTRPPEPESKEERRVLVFDLVVASCARSPSGGGRRERAHVGQDPEGGGGQPLHADL